jgi:1-acyl-sn-glycerol-3-phosphate acyltransferase
MLVLWPKGGIMNLMKWIVTYGCKLGLHLAYRIDDAEMAKIRARGPLIAFTNHRSLLEAPVIYTSLQPRPMVTALAKAEYWQRPFFAFVFNLWGIIPVQRGEADMEALRASIDALKRGSILGIAPEGTRTKTGAMQRAHGGIAVLALHSGAPLQPIAHWGSETEGDKKRAFRPDFHIRVGRAFRLDAHGERITKEIRQEMADEIMYQLALILPEALRGEYADLDKASSKWLVFEDGGI